jgi:plastocyanin
MFCALFSLVAAGCHEETSMPSSVPPTTTPATPTDLAGVVNVDAGAVAGMFPSSAAITVGPNGMLVFSPSTVDIAAGGTVTWTWAAGNVLLHNVTSGDAVPAFAPSATQMSGTFAHTFPTAGSFSYFCSIHGRTVMFGTVNVH